MAITDVFVFRYRDAQFWPNYGETERRFLNQCAQLIAHEVLPIDWKAKDRSNADTLQWAHHLLARELGLQSLYKTMFLHETLVAGVKNQQWMNHTIDFMTTQYLIEPPHPETDAVGIDWFMKTRISLVELCFQRRHSANVAARKAHEALPSLSEASAGQRSGHALAQWARGLEQIQTVRESALTASEAALTKQIGELNGRLRHAGFPFSYHNHLIQRSDDARTENEIERPFWALVAAPKWQNVDTLTKEAIDKRDRGERDAVTPALQALESAIKIISDEKGWTRGTEKGAAQYIDNLVVERGGTRFIEVWEKDALVKLFGDIRNWFGHGPGSKPMPSLLPQQTDWAIEACMAWIKSLVKRL